MNQSIKQALIDGKHTSPDGTYVQIGMDALMSIVSAPTARQVPMAVLEGQIERLRKNDFAGMETMRTFALGIIDDLLTPSAAMTVEPADWQDDPSADERWNAGLDFGQQQLCKYLGVDPDDVTWDAATEELEGDVQAVIGNIMRAKFGEDWTPSDGAIYAAVSRTGTTDAEHADLMRDVDAKLGDLAIPSTATSADASEWQDAFCALRDMWDEDECPSWPDVSSIIEKLCRSAATPPSSGNTDAVRALQQAGLALDEIIQRTVNPAPTNMSDRRVLDWVNSKARAAHHTVNAALSSAPVAGAESNYQTKLAVIITWLEVNQPDVFKRGLWDALTRHDRGGPQS